MQDQEQDERGLELLESTCSAGSLLVRLRSPASKSDTISVSLALVVELSAGPAGPSEVDTTDKIDMRLKTFLMSCFLFVILMSSAVLWQLRGKSIIAFESGIEILIFITSYIICKTTFCLLHCLNNVTKMSYVHNRPAQSFFGKMPQNPQWSFGKACQFFSHFDII